MSSRHRATSHGTPQVIFLDSGPPMREFCEKSLFYPLKRRKMLGTLLKIWKEEVGWSRPGEEGGSPMWKNFAFLDELDHLEAKKYQLFVENEGYLMETFHQKIFCYLCPPLLIQYHQHHLQSTELPSYCHMKSIVQCQTKGKACYLNFLIAGNHVVW